MLCSMLMLLIPTHVWAQPVMGTASGVLTNDLQLVTTIATSAQAAENLDPSWAVVGATAATPWVASESRACYKNLTA